MRPVAIITRNVDASSQCTARSAWLNRRTYSDAVAVGASDPGIDVVAVLLPVSGDELGDELDPGEPLHVLVAVHLGDHEPERRPVGAAERRAVHMVGEHDLREGRLVEREG